MIRYTNGWCNGGHHNGCHDICYHLDFGELACPSTEDTGRLEAVTSPRLVAVLTHTIHATTPMTRWIFDHVMRCGRRQSITIAWGQGRIVPGPAARLVMTNGFTHAVRPCDNAVLITGRVSETQQQIRQRLRQLPLNVAGEHHANTLNPVHLYAALAATA